MKRTRKGLAAALMVVFLAAPLQGCAPKLPGAGAIPNLALSLAASVGSYLLIRELQ